MAKKQQRRNKKEMSHWAGNNGNNYNGDNRITVVGLDKTVLGEVLCFPYEFNNIKAVFQEENTRVPGVYKELNAKHIEIVMPADYIQWKAKSGKTVAMCAFNASMGFISCNLGKRLDGADEAWYKAIPQTHAEGLREGATFDVIQELVRPYGIGISEIWVRSDKFLNPDLDKWREYLPANPLFNFSDPNGNSAGLTDKEALANPLADMFVDEKDTWRMHRIKGHESLDGPLIYMRGGASAAGGGGHATYIGPRWSDKNFDYAIRLDHLSNINYIKVPDPIDTTVEMDINLPESYLVKSTDGNVKVKDLYPKGVTYSHNNPYQSGGTNSSAHTVTISSTADEVIKFMFTAAPGAGVYSSDYNKMKSMFSQAFKGGFEAVFSIDKPSSYTKDFFPLIASLNKMFLLPTDLDQLEKASAIFSKQPADLGDFRLSPETKENPYPTQIRAWMDKVKTTIDKKEMSLYGLWSVYVFFNMYFNALTEASIKKLYGDKLGLMRVLSTWAIDYALKVELAAGVEAKVKLITVEPAEKKVATIAKKSDFLAIGGIKTAAEFNQRLTQLAGEGVIQEHLSKTDIASFTMIDDAIKAVRTKLLKNKSADIVPECILGQDFGEYDLIISKCVEGRRKLTRIASEKLFESMQSVWKGKNDMPPADLCTFQAAMLITSWFCKPAFAHAVSLYSFFATKTQSTAIVKDYTETKLGHNDMFKAFVGVLRSIHTAYKDGTLGPTLDPGIKLSQETEQVLRIYMVPPSPEVAKLLEAVIQNSEEGYMRWVDKQVLADWKLTGPTNFIELDCKKGNFWNITNSSPSDAIFFLTLYAAVVLAVDQNENEESLRLFTHSLFTEYENCLVRDVTEDISKVIFIEDTIETVAAFPWSVYGYITALLNKKVR